jgi:hypothetical protein
MLLERREAVFAAPRARPRAWLLPLRDLLAVFDREAEERLVARAMGNYSS